MEIFVDVVLLAILAASTVSGFRRGFVRSLVDLVGGIVALVAAVSYASSFAAWAQNFMGPSAPNWVKNPLLAKVVAALLLFAIFEAVLQAAAGLLNRVCRLPVLRQLNSLLGGGVGFCKGAVIVMILCAALRAALPVAFPAKTEVGAETLQKAALSRIYQAVAERNPIYMLFQTDLGSGNEVGKNEV